MKKMVWWLKCYSVYDVENKYKVGDKVCIEECKLIFKLKCWIVVELVL